MVPSLPAAGSALTPPGRILTLARAVGRWMAVALGLVLLAAALFVLLTTDRAATPHAEIDDASREKLERVLRDAGDG